MDMQPEGTRCRSTSPHPAAVLLSFMHEQGCEMSQIDELFRQEHACRAGSGNRRSCFLSEEDANPRERYSMMASWAEKRAERVKTGFPYIETKAYW